MEINRVSTSPTSPLKTSRPLTAQPLATTEKPNIGIVGDQSASKGIDVSKLQFDTALTPETMKELDKLATMELAPGINQEELLNTVIQNLQNPESITQGDRQTCAAATVQTLLAKQDPAEYVRLVAGLASPEGKVALKDGSVLGRDSLQMGNGRSIVDNLMQPALMQRATNNGYNAATDTRRDGKGQGLYAAEQANLTSAVLGKQMVAVKGNDAAVLQAAADALKNGGPVSATIQVTDPATGAVKGHSVSIQKMENGIITYLDPKKGRVTMPIEKFKAQLESVNIPKEDLTRELRTRVMQENEGILAAGFFKKLAKGIKNFAKGIVKSVVKSIVKPFDFLEDLAKKAKEGLKKVGSTIKKVWKKIAPIVMTALPVVMMFVPGGQVVSAALSAIQAAKSAGNMIKAIKNGDWKAALTGAASVLGAVAGGITAGGASVFGAGAAKVAAMAQKGADIINKGTAVVDAIKSKNPSAILGALSNAGVKIGSNVTSFANKALDIAQKATDYADKAKKAYEAVRGGDILDGIAAAGDLAAEATGNKKLSKISETTKKVQSTAEAIQSGNIENILNSAKGLGLTIDPQVEKALGKAKDAVAVKKALEKGDIQGALDTAKSLGVKIDPKVEQAIAYTQDAKALTKAVKNGNIDAALNSAKDLGISTTGLEKALGTVKDAAEVKKALEKGDIQGALTNAKTLGVKIDPKVEQTLTYAQNAKGLTEAVKSGDIEAALNKAKDLGISTTAFEKALGTAKDAEAVKKALEKGDIQGAVDTAKKMGVKIDGKAEQAITYAQNVQDLADAMAKADVQRALDRADDLGVELNPYLKEVLTSI